MPNTEWTERHILSEPEYNMVFEVPGEPQGKGRPRFARAGAGVRTYTPQKTASYENRIYLSFLRLGKARRFLKGPVRMKVEAFFIPPKSWSKRKIKDALSGALHVTKKPDLDNIIKAVKDALEGPAYKNDSQIIELHAYKRYAIRECVRVSLGPVL